MNLSISIGIPQAIVLILYAITVINNIVHHGEPKDECYNWGYTSIGAVIGLSLLYWGGFFF